jgi:hypothetical protein
MEVEGHRGIFPFPDLTTHRRDVGLLQCADPSDKAERDPGVSPSRTLAAAAVVAVALAGCTDDDDASPATTTAAPVTTEVATTSVPSTTSATTTTTSPTTTPAPSTTVDVVALKAQIAADYLTTEQASEDLSRNPTLDRLDEKVAAIATPGSTQFESVRQSVQNLVARGQRVAPGTPDYSESSVESVELDEDGAAQVTACLVTNQVLVDSSGQTVGGLSDVTAAKIRQPMERTAEGWRQSDQGTRVSIREGATTCAP